MKLYRTALGVVVESHGRFHSLEADWNTLINHADLLAHLRAATTGRGETTLQGNALAPVTSQEVWAAGVTYLRSRSARIEESQDAGGGTFYDRVYNAARPEIFFKASAFRVRASGETIRIRADAKWSVPEPELALYINARGQIIGYTIANDVSSRDIEGENPLYLPQAKIYDGSCALGPAVLMTDAPLAPETPIELRITRDGSVAFEGSTTFSQLKRTPVELVEYLYRETSFPDGCVLLTGTGVIPPDHFTLQSGDDVEIHIPPIGTLRNTVA
ncbi:MAG: fumarylacetoacetate hydrolase family protein [Gemmatimonadaceae bacterium]